ncbi:hypothetical protein GCM10007301_30360 [Azorhizobium oxalatiphilum]|uniref:Uncharacterized protein n=1 Tax=Azorhizobium oxalatiphilum TaxID=980631 RepID=A0A917C3S7_9HYPH|nr:hypothetical protein [Azorhizobium oxalatiphilum]GGF68625.1 hypothetical protein GCM10007301_30360 [Azorhizobium oxalatiphilum]
MLKKIVIAAAILLATPALAQHAHDDKGPNGGQMQDVAGVHAEFLPSGNSLVLNIIDEAGKPIDTKGFVASALVVSGGERKTVQLIASGSSLRADLPSALPAGSTVTFAVKSSAGKSGQAKFTTR